MKRKKKFLALGLAAVMLLSSITIAFAVTTADNVKTEGFEIPDKALVQALIDNGADANEDGTITVAEMEGLTGLYASYQEEDTKPIKNLSGIEYAKNLTYINLENNEIEDVTPLKNLNKLEKVRLRDNPVSAQACKELQETIVRPITLMENQLFYFERNLNIFMARIDADHYSTPAIVDVLSADSAILKVERRGSIDDYDDSDFSLIGTALKPGDTSVQIKLNDGLALIIPVHVDAESVPAPLTALSSNIPVLSNFGQLTKTDKFGRPYNIASSYGQGVTAMYPSGELYFIGNHGEVLLAENVKDYVAVSTDDSYAGGSVYHNQFNILDNNNTLWKWSWPSDSDQPHLTKVSDEITALSAGTALDTRGNLLDIRAGSKPILNDVMQIYGINYVLKKDGTVWKNVYDTLSAPSYQFTKLYDNVKELIGYDTYVKQDGTTWVGDKKIADFGATTMSSCWIKDEAGNSTYYYLVVKEDGSVWKINSKKTSDCAKISDHFLRWCESNGTVGFYTTDGGYYSLYQGSSEEVLHQDKSLWCVSYTSAYKFLTSVEDYAKIQGGMYSTRGEDEFLAVRSDGSIWGYHFNEASKYVPVMVKAPIDKEPTPAFTLGDVNLDGKVNTSDARLALRGAATLETLTDQQVLAADVNKNGKADTSDARKILRVAANLDQF